MTDIDTESARVRRDTRIAEAAAKQATEDANDFATGARVEYRSAVELEQSAAAAAAAAAQRGDARQAEEDTELAAHARGSAKRYEQQEREATLDAAKHREEAAGYDRAPTTRRSEATDTFAEQDFASNDSPAESFGADADSSFSESDFA